MAIVDSGVRIRFFILTTGRGYPDISAQALNLQITAAGVISLLNDFLISKGKSPLGFLNPLIYSTAATGFNDITSGSNPGCGTSGFSAAKGWDPATGMGTPDFVKVQGIVACRIRLAYNTLRETRNPRGDVYRGLRSAPVGVRGPISLPLVWSAAEQPCEANLNQIPICPVFTLMSKTSTKKRPNKKPALAALAATKKRLSLGNTSTSKPPKKTRKKNASHQQTIQARDTLDAEYRDWRTGGSFLTAYPLPFGFISQTTSVMDLLQPPDGSTTTTTTTSMTVSQTAGLGSPSVQISEQSVQDLAGVLSAL
ncbi:hypothetical protein V8E52_006101 [Russula decolorans]